MKKWLYLRILLPQFSGWEARKSKCGIFFSLLSRAYCELHKIGPLSIVLRDRYFVRVFWKQLVLNIIVLPTSRLTTEVFAPSTKILKKTESMFGFFKTGKFSAGILLAAPTAKLKTVTAKDIDINLFSVMSCMGFIQEKNIPYRPAMTNVKPM